MDIFSAALRAPLNCRHRGLANKTTGTARPLVYVTYAKPFFRDEANFSKKRYRSLPPLVPVRKRK